MTPVGLAQVPPGVDLTAPLDIPRGPVQLRERKRRGRAPMVLTPAPPVERPPTPAVVDPDAAEWIRTVVLPPYYREEVPARLIALCACQLGTCGACGRGRHDRCLSRGDRSGHPMWETSVVDRRGFVATGAGPGGAKVWRAGAPCRYRCPCSICAEAVARPAASTLEPDVQLDLFGELV